MLPPARLLMPYIRRHTMRRRQDHKIDFGEGSTKATSSCGARLNSPDLSVTY